jgi:cobalt/nickel transport system permease protein
MTAIVFRSLLAFLALIWLVNVMPFDQLLFTLRRLWVPEILIAMLAFMYRYVFVLWDELDRMRVARRARTFGDGALWLRWKASAQLIGMLLIRAMERAERVHGAMCARGWDGRVRFFDQSGE